jgi:voltage-dependent potassium channel beta subunit
MNYRRLGRTGLKLSELSFGSWVTYGNQMGESVARECMAAAHDAGVNFFDNAEVYAHGDAETLMGEALRKLGWRRSSYVLSTKFYWGLHDGPNERNTLNRKYLMQAIDGSLARLGLDCVDLVYCHRPDPDTPIEETVWAMDTLIRQGKVLYWGTSEWPAEAIREAHEIARAHHLHAPTMEQPQYNLLHRERVEVEYAPLYREFGMGTTIWSPLASGVLTGKYSQGVPADSRMATPGYEWLRGRVDSPEGRADLARADRLVAIAKELGISPAQFAIAWCLKNPHVSTVMLGATKRAHLEENLGAMDALDKLDDAVMRKVDGVLG